MRNLYRAIGIDGPSNNFALIEKSIGSCTSAAHAAQAQMVLLNRDRKAVYDRTHATLQAIGQIRSTLGTERSELWLETEADEFLPATVPPAAAIDCVLRWFDTPQKVIVALVLLIFGGVIVWDGVQPREEQSRSAQVTAPSPSRLPERANDYVPDRSVSEAAAFDTPAVPFPSNGTQFVYLQRDAVAPLEILTRSTDGNYFIKLVTLNTKRTVAVMYVHGGQRAELLVPLGTYELRYAYGKTWYGPDHLFGPATRYAKAEEEFEFTLKGNHYNGYTVELYLQVDGNLHTTPISPEDF